MSFSLKPLAPFLLLYLDFNRDFFFFDEGGFRCSLEDFVDGLDFKGESFRSTMAPI